jgi:hypothetical protein
MLARLSAVVEDVVVIATSILQRIGKDGHSVKGFLDVDAVGERNDCGSEQEGVECDGAERGRCPLLNRTVETVQIQAVP